MDKFWLLVLLFLLSVHPSGVQAERLVVDQSGGGDFSTIRKAVNAADAGDEILVSPGYYKEGVIPILRPLALTGSPGQATLEGGFVVEASGSSVSGFEIRGFGSGVAVELKSHQTTLEGCTI